MCIYITTYIILLLDHTPFYFSLDDRVQHIFNVFLCALYFLYIDLSKRKSNQAEKNSEIYLTSHDANADCVG